MRPDDADLGYVWDMLEAARESVSFLHENDLSSFQDNRVLIRAVERSIQIIGEAASRVAQEFRSAHPEVPWQKIAAQRHVLVHEYAEIDQSLLWNLVRQHIPELIPKLQSILDHYPPPE